MSVKEVRVINNLQVLPVSLHMCRCIRDFFLSSEVLKINLQYTFIILFLFDQYILFSVSF